MESSHRFRDCFIERFFVSDLIDGRVWCSRCNVVNMGVFVVLELVAKCFLSVFALP